MKRVKMMLTAITVFAVVGGALAFKAKNNYGAVIFTGSVANSCPNETPNFTSTTTSSSPSIFLTIEGGDQTKCEQTYTVGLN
jgi:hypothetical protein